MSLIRCPECGNSVSEKATTCLKCGFGVAAEIEHQRNEAIGLASIREYQYSTQKKREDTFWNVANIVSLIGIVALMVAVFLPLVKTEIWGMKIGTSLLDGGDGIIILVVAGVALLFLFLNKQILFSISGILCVILVVVEILDFNDKLTELGEWAALIQKGAGYTLLILSAIAIGIGVVLQFFLDD